MELVPATPCTPHGVGGYWNCPVSIWNQVPWGVTHHFFWSSLNGALFGSKDIAGNVKISGNHVIDAYNGFRARMNATCLADPACRTRVNVGFEITDNVFERIRDNPVEPEGHAAYWIVKHNTFVDVHAAISTDECPDMISLCSGTCSCSGPELAQNARKAHGWAADSFGLRWVEAAGGAPRRRAAMKRSARHMRSAPS
jgi:hypothetical protein